MIDFSKGKHVIGVSDTGHTRYRRKGLHTHEESTLKRLVRIPCESAYPDPYVFEKGERLHIEKRDAEWPGWIWCTNEKGKSAWVPEQWVELRGELCVLLRKYSSRELTVRLGEEIEWIDEVNGWMLVRNAKGEEGWIPADRIEP